MDTAVILFCRRPEVKSFNTMIFHASLPVIVQMADAVCAGLLADVFRFLFFFININVVYCLHYRVGVIIHPYKCIMVLGQTPVNIFSTVTFNLDDEGLRRYGCRRQ